MFWPVLCMSSGRPARMPGGHVRKRPRPGAAAAGGMMVKWFAGLALALLLVLPAPSGAAEKKMVLYINSYHNGYAWSDDILRGIRSTLAESEQPIELQIEYLDSKKYDYDRIAPELARLYRDKFAREHFDVIIVSDDNALNFVLDYGEGLFPGTPVLFCGINTPVKDRIRGRDITGVLENIDPGGLFEIALKLHPGLKRAVVIGDETITGRAIRAQIQRVVPDFAGRLEFEFWSEINLGKTLQTVSAMSSDTMIYFIPFFLSINGIYYSADELSGMVARTSNVPTYSNWAFLFGHGEVGGPLLSGVRHGHDVARLALRVLAGERAGSIPVQTEVHSDLLFDYKVLKARKIDMKLLPPESHFINAPSPFYELNKQLFWTIMAFLAVLLVTLALLVRNIVRRRAAEKEIISQLSFMELLLDTIPLHICWKDLEQRYLGVNRSFTDFYGMDSSEHLLHRTDQEVQMDSEFRKCMSQLDKEVVVTGRPVLKNRTPVTDHRGEQVVLEVTKVPLKSFKGEIVGTLSIVDNVTREVSLERQLIQSQRMEAIGTLAGGVAHDFNNILTAILNSAELALGDLAEGTPARRDLERVIKAARRGSGVVRQILAFSRPTKEGFTNVSIAGTVREAVSLMAHSLPRNIRVEMDIAAQDSIISADPHQIHQVVMNLCTNSYQAMRTTGGRITVGLAEEDLDADWAQLLSVTPGRYLRLTVADDGPGIPTEIVDKVFDPFFTTKGLGEGTGLGLAVVHGIVRNHKGAVRLRSTPGVETVVDLFLPLHQGGAESASPEQAAPSLGSGRLLFVEDDEDQLITTPRLLESLGYSVTAASRADQALAELARAPRAYHLLVTDFDMPGTNGLELARQAVRLRPGLPVLLVSGRDGAAEAAASADFISGVLLKPYSKAAISEAIRRALADRGGERGPDSHH